MIDKIQPDPEPTSNLVEFRRGPRVPTMQVKPTDYLACKHPRTIISKETRTVECRDCDVILDAFTVLLELANRERAWMSELDRWEAYRDSQLAERYDEQWARDHHGDLHRPVDPETAAVWDTFAAYFGPKFVRMYRLRPRKRNGPDWYGVSSSGGCVSFEYARAQIVPKAVK